MDGILVRNYPLSEEHRLVEIFNANWALSNLEDSIEYVVDNLIPTKNLSVFFGDPGSLGKTPIGVKVMENIGLLWSTKWYSHGIQFGFLTSPRQKWGGKPCIRDQPYSFQLRGDDLIEKSNSY